MSWLHVCLDMSAFCLPNSLFMCNFEKKTPVGLQTCRPLRCRRPCQWFLFRFEIIILGNRKNCIHGPFQLPTRHYLSRFNLDALINDGKQLHLTQQFVVSFVKKTEETSWPPKLRRSCQTLVITVNCFEFGFLTLARFERRGRIFRTVWRGTDSDPIWFWSVWLHCLGLRQLSLWHASRLICQDKQTGVISAHIVCTPLHQLANTNYP